jgi:WD40 repeat protein
VVVYHGLTGRLAAVLGGHDGLVYSVAWAADDSAVVTAGADLAAKVRHPFSLEGSAPEINRRPHPALLHLNPAPLPLTVAPTPIKVWHLPRGLLAAPDGGALPGGTLRGIGGSGSGGGGSGSGGGGSSSLAATGALEGAGGGADGEGSPTCRCVTLQHACFVYAAAPCPAPGLGGAVVATGGFDGVLRLWDAAGPGGMLLHGVRATRGRLECLVFDSLGTRLYAGDSEGVVREPAALGWMG